MALRQVSSRTLFLCGSSVDFLTLFVPGVDPHAETAGEGAAGYRNYFTYRLRSKRLQRFPLGITNQIECASLGYEEVLPPSLDVADATAVQRLDFLTTSIIYVIPVLGGLDILNLLLCPHGYYGT